MTGNKDVRPSQIFICYAREDTQAAERMYQDLKKRGLSPFLDKFSIWPGQNWKQEITQAIRRSRFVLVLLSTSSLSKKGYVQREVREAIDNSQEFPDSEIYIIPVRLDECEPQDEKMRELQYADMFSSWNDGLDRILESVNLAASQTYVTDLDKQAYSQWLYVGNYNKEQGQWVENQNGYISTVKEIEHLTPQGLIYKVLELARNTNVRAQPGVREQERWVAYSNARVEILAVFEAFHFNPVVRRIWVAIARQV